MTTRYIEVRFICPATPDREEAFILGAGSETIEEIRDIKQASMDALGCGGRHTILSVGEVDAKHAALTTKKQMDSNEAAYYAAFDEEDDEDYEPQYDDDDDDDEDWEDWDADYLED